MSRSLSAFSMAILFLAVAAPIAVLAGDIGNMGLDDSGNVFINQYHEYCDIAVTWSYDTECRTRWQKTREDVSITSPYLNMDADGNVIIIEGTILVTKYDNAGDIIWAYQKKEGVVTVQQLLTTTETSLSLGMSRPKTTRTQTNLRSSS